MASTNKLQELQKLGVEVGWIGGSDTWSAIIPEQLGREDVEVVDRFTYLTPDGRVSGLWKLLRLKLSPTLQPYVLRLTMHGCWPKKGTAHLPEVSAAQAAWVFQQVGVKYVISGGSVGGINMPGTQGEMLPPGALVAPTDFIMAWPVADDPGKIFFSGGDESIFFRSGQPFCLPLRQFMVTAALERFGYGSGQVGYGVYDADLLTENIVYACTPFGRFESAQEIVNLRVQGAHIVGQTIGHEAVNMRRAGIHFASLHIVSNYVEPGIPHLWVGETPGAMAEFYQSCAVPMGNLMVDTLKNITLALSHGPLDECACPKYMITGLGKFPVAGA